MIEWFKSQASNPSGNCVEVAAGETGIHVRDSKRPLWGRLTFSPSEWEQFVAEVKAGRHDVSALLIAADVAIHVDGCSGESCQGECERLSRRAEIMTAAASGGDVIERAADQVAEQAMDIIDKAVSDGILPG